MKRIIIFILCIAYCLPLFAEADNQEDDNTDYIPVAYGYYLSFGEQSLRGLGGGLVVMSGDFDNPAPEERDNLQIVALYTRHDLMEEPGEDYPAGYNNIDFLLQKKTNRHQYFSLLKSYADKPLFGGLETFDFVNGYGYEVWNTEGHSLWLGGSLGISDWGVKLPDGAELPVLPLPFVRYDYFSDIFAFSFDFTTSPMVDVILNPEGQLRFNTSFIIVDFGELDNNGMKYDLSLEYRFFDKNHPFGDFAGVKAGYMAEDFEYAIADSGGDAIQIAWQSVYGTLDLSFLEITGGYAFGGQENLSPGKDSDLDAGYYVSLQAAWAF